jgi:D-tyrosyl-tRNA(Tyr) deacylase
MKSCKDNDYEILIVSQFTLYGIWKGNKPDFHYSMPPKEAREVYDAFVRKVKQLYYADKVQGMTRICCRNCLRR